MHGIESMLLPNELVPMMYFMRSLILGYKFIIFLGRLSFKESNSQLSAVKNTKIKKIKMIHVKLQTGISKSIFICHNSRLSTTALVGN